MNICQETSVHRILLLLLVCGEKQKLIEYSQNIIPGGVQIFIYLSIIQFRQIHKNLKRLQCENEKFPIISKHIHTHF